MAKYCSVCGRYSDDNAVVCAVCGTPLPSAYGPDDEGRTLAADDAFGPSYTEPSYQQPAPAYQQPAPAYQDSDGATVAANEYYQQPAPAPAPAPEYQQPAPAYQDTDGVTVAANGYYQQSAQTPAPAPAPAPTPAPAPMPQNAKPLNMNTPVYGVPLQQGGYRPGATKNNNMKLGIIIVSAIVVVIVAVVLLVIFIPKGSDKSSGSNSSGGGSSVVTTSLQGSYYANSITTGGQTYDRSTIQAGYGGDVTLTVDSENIGTMMVPGVSSETIVFDPSDNSYETDLDSGSYSLSGNTLTIRSQGDGSSIVFVKG